MHMLQAQKGSHNLSPSFRAKASHQVEISTDSSASQPLKGMPTNQQCSYNTAIPSEVNKKIKQTIQINQKISLVTWTLQVTNILGWYLKLLWCVEDAKTLYLWLFCHSVCVCMYKIIHASIHPQKFQSRWCLSAKYTLIWGLCTNQTNAVVHLCPSKLLGIRHLQIKSTAFPFKE